MKEMKRLASLLLVLVMVFALSSTAWAANEGGVTTSADTGTITVNNATNGETYTLYKVFDATTIADREDNEAGIAYTSTWLTTGNEWFDVDSAGNITIKEEGKNTDGNLSDGAIAWLKTQINCFTSIGDKLANGNSVEWTGLADGYYYITTTTGSFVMVNSIAPNVTVQDKNTVSSVDKKQGKSANGSFDDDVLYLNMGDTVYYQITVTIGKGADKAITVTDTLSEGLTLVENSISVKDHDGDLSPTNLNITETTNGFTVSLIDEYVQSLREDDVVIVTYSATVDTDATVDNATANENKVAWTNSTQSGSDAVYVATFDFTLKKTDGVNHLAGAKFKLYDALNGGNEIKLAKDTTGYYVSATGTDEISVDSEDGVNIRGLAPGTYYLEETKTPDGYNTLTSRQAVIIKSDGTAPVMVQVINNKGTELPSTGSMGTRIFYIVGAVLVLGAVVLLIARKRMGSSER